MDKDEKEDWPITNEYRAAIVKSLVKIVIDPMATSTEKTAASRALIAAEALNQAAQREADKW